MKTVSTALANHIATGKELIGIDLYTFALLNGQTVRWSGGDVAVPYGGNTFVLGPKINRGEQRLTAGLQVDTLMLTVYPEDTDVIGSVPVRKMMLRGDFDGAAFMRQRAYLSAPNTAPMDVLTRMVGYVGSITGGGMSLTVMVNSMMAKFSQPFPRNVYQAACSNTLFDSICGLSTATWRSTGTISTVTSTASFTSTLTQADDFFTGGRVRFLSGRLEGTWLPIKAFMHASGSVTLARPPADVLQAGDTFEVWPGCDKKLATCTTKFGNIIHFRGQPFIPAAETTL